MKKNIDLIIDGIAPKKVMYDTDNHSLVVLYPAQEEFKKGDILSSLKHKYAMCIYKDKSPTITGNISAYLGIDSGGRLFPEISNSWGAEATYRHATEEEQQTLFDALEKKGKKWNAETLEIEEIIPEFKKGDILAFDDKTLLIFYGYTNKDKNSFHSLWNNKGMSNINWQTKCFKHATDEQIAQLHEDLKKEGKKWNEETLEIEDLDISEIVVDLKSATEYLGCQKYIYNADRKDKRLNKFEAQITLQLIAEAWNKFDGFETDWENWNQLKYVPVLKVRDGNIKFSYTSFIMSVLDFHTSNFSFKTEERAKQFGEQFIDLFKVAFGV